MNIPETFTAVFYDEKLPKTSHYAIYKKVSRQEYNNLTDGIEGKEVQLKEQSGAYHNYKILSQIEFNIDGIVQNQVFVIFICSQIKPVLNQYDNPITTELKK